MVRASHFLSGKRETSEMRHQLQPGRKNQKDDGVGKRDRGEKNRLGG